VLLIKQKMCVILFAHGIRLHLPTACFL
jgi:hypothetical protein